MAGSSDPISLPEVTGNALLLLGYIGGAIVRDQVYEIESISVATGVQVIRRAGTGNLYTVRVQQIEGVE